jgi:uncharacterized membrane-anchored protein YjiN (DUF445 family)
VPDLDEFEFLLEERHVRIRLLENIPRVSVAGLTIEGLKGQEVEVPLWVAEELVRSGKGELLGEDFGLKELARAHLGEVISSTKRLSMMNEDFYFNLRRFLRKLRVESEGNPEKVETLEKAYSMARDIVNCRMRKLASIAASQAGDEVTKDFTLEEKLLYSTLKRMINDWSRRLLEDPFKSEGRSCL